MANKFSSIKTGYDKLYPVFSFANYKETKYFSDRDIKDKKEFYRFFNHIKQLSSETWYDIKTKPTQFHFHEIDDDKNIHSKLGLSDNIDVIQFKLPSDKESRIVGYFDNNNIFNIVAYDYNHQVYPRK